MLHWLLPVPALKALSEQEPRQRDVEGLRLFEQQQGGGQSSWRLQQDARKIFERDGVYVVRSAVSAAEAGFINAQLRSHSAETGLRAFGGVREHMRTAPAAACLHNSTSLHAALAGIFGGVSAYRPTARAEYTVNKLKSWHRDLLKHDLFNDLAASYFQPGPNVTLDMFGRGPDGEPQLFVLAAMYLQDHSADDGGLTVRPGTHRHSLCCHPADGLCPSRLSSPAAGASCHSAAPETTLHPRLGDVLLMDYNLVHRSSLRLSRDAKRRNRMLFAMGYSAQDNLFSDAADQHCPHSDPSRLPLAARCRGLPVGHPGRRARPTRTGAPFFAASATHAPRVQAKSRGTRHV